MRIISSLVVAAVICVSGASFASGVSSGSSRTISECFHPFSEYVGADWEDWVRVSSHTKQASGVIRYLPLNNHIYRMPAVFMVREVDGERMYRVVPDDEADTGPWAQTPPAA